MLNFNSSHNITEKSHLYDTDKLDQVMSHLIGNKFGDNTKKNTKKTGGLTGGLKSTSISYPSISYDKSSRIFTVILSMEDRLVFSYQDIVNSILNINIGSPVDLFIKKNIGYIDKNRVVIINYQESPIMGDLDMLVRLNNDLKQYESNELEKQENKYIISLFIYELLNYTLGLLVIISDMIKDRPDKQILSKYILRYTVANTFRMYNFSNNMNKMLSDKIKNLEQQKDQSSKIMNIIGGKTDDMLKHINHNNSCFQKIASNSKIYSLVGGDIDDSDDSDSNDDTSSDDKKKKKKLETDSEDEEYLKDDTSLTSDDDDNDDSKEEEKEIEDQEEEDDNEKNMEEEVEEKESDSSSDRDSDKDEQEDE